MEFVRATREKSLPKECPHWQHIISRKLAFGEFCKESGLIDEGVQTNRALEITVHDDNTSL